jgi:hypothetical protein
MHHGRVQPVMLQPVPVKGGMDGAREHLPTQVGLCPLGSAVSICPPDATVETLEIFSTTLTLLYKRPGLRRLSLSVFSRSLRTCRALLSSRHSSQVTPPPHIHPARIIRAASLRPILDIFVVPAHISRHLRCIAICRVLVLAACRIIFQRNYRQHSTRLQGSAFVATATCSSTQNRQYRTCCVSALSLGSSAQHRPHRYFSSVAI